MTKKVRFDFGWANGWSAAQQGMFDRIISILDADPATEKKGESLGNCVSHTIWENADFILDWKVDCSD